MVNAATQTALVTLAQIEPIAVIFTAPEAQLPEIKAALAVAPPETIALSTDGKRVLSTGTLALINNQVDTTSGTIRLKDAGGHGGHNGLRDLIAAQGDGFWRLRIGVGHPGNSKEVVDFVLTRAGADEQRAIDETIAAGADAVEEMLRNGAQIAMNKLHSKPANSGLSKEK
jgi:hypothetical protein